jgi:hypothetical protein
MFTAQRKCLSCCRITKKFIFLNSTRLKIAAASNLAPSTRWILLPVLRGFFFESAMFSPMPFRFSTKCRWRPERLDGDWIVIERATGKRAVGTAFNSYADCWLFIVRQLDEQRRREREA